MFVDKEFSADKIDLVLHFYQPSDGQKIRKVFEIRIWSVIQKQTFDLN